MALLKLALGVAWKSIALVLAGVALSVVLILVALVFFGSGIGDPCPPYC